MPPNSAYGTLSGGPGTFHVQTSVRILSVTMTNKNAAVKDLDIYHYSVVSGDGVIHLCAAQNDTIQAHFRGVPFQSGFTIVLDADAEYFLIEYETLPEPN